MQLMEATRKEPSLVLRDILSPELKKRRSGNVVSRNFQNFD